MARGTCHHRYPDRGPQPTRQFKGSMRLQSDSEWPKLELFRLFVSQAEYQNERELQVPITFVIPHPGA